MNILQLFSTIDADTIKEFFYMILSPGIAAGFAFGSVLHLIGFAVFRVLSFLNTK